MQFSLYLNRDFLTDIQMQLKLWKLSLHMVAIYPNLESTLGMKELTS